MLFPLFCEIKEDYSVYSDELDGRKSQMDRVNPGLYPLIRKGTDNWRRWADLPEEKMTETAGAVAHNLGPGVLQNVASAWFLLFNGELRRAVEVMNETRRR